MSLSKKIINKGAESVIYLIDDKKESIKKIIKERIVKRYRHKELDNKIRKSHSKREWKILNKLYKKFSNNNFLGVPKPIKFDESNYNIEMEYIEGVTLKSILEELIYNEEKYNLILEYIRKLAYFVHEIHKEGIIHGDLTPKNVLIYNNKIYLIDFGLSYYSHNFEDKATDLLVMKDVLNELSNKGVELFNFFLNCYIKKLSQNEANIIVHKIEEIEKRGRYKNKS